MLFSLDKVPRPKFRSKKVIWLASVSALLTVLYFWFFSRYPQIFQKVAMSDRIPLSGIGFDQLINPNRFPSGFKRILAVTVNWYYTNWKGMFFGLLIAAIMMTLVRQISAKRINGLKDKGGVLKSLLGVFVGSPLGVCANCAAPIGKGALDGGLPVLTSLSMMMSSPVFNIIILSFLFTLFPLYMGTLKIVGNLLVILVILPPLVKRFAPEEGFKNNINMFFDDTPEKEVSWLSALNLFLDMFFQNFWYIIKTTVPFMLAAGFFGAVVFEFVPKDSLFDINESAPAMLLTAMVGTFLPVPIMFDLLLPVALMSAGLPISLGAILLFTLGGTSVYSLWVSKKMAGGKLAMSVAASFVLVGFLVGQTTSVLDHYITDKTMSGMQKKFDSGKRRAFLETKAIIAQECAFLRDYAPDCRKQLEREYIFSRAVQMGETDFCSMLMDKKTREDCELESWVTMAIKQHKVHICGSIEGRERQHECRRHLLNSIAMKKMWEVKKLFRKIDCKEFAGDYVSEQFCQSLLEISSARNLLSTKSCDRIENEKVKKRCYSFVNVAPEALKDKVVCREDVEEISPICLTKLGETYYENNPGKKICQEYKSEKARNQCETVYALEMAKKNNQPEYCAELKQANFRRFCYITYVRYRVALSLNNLADKKIGAFTEKAHQWVYPDFSKVKGPLLKKAGETSGRGYQLESWVLYPSNGQSRNIFDIQDARNFGLDTEYEFDVKDLFAPFNFGRSISAGNINGDLWPDLVIPRASGVEIWLNDGKGKFHKQFYNAEKNQGLEVFLAMLVDLNNDDLSDLVFTNSKGELWVTMNDGNTYGEPTEINLGLDRGSVITALAAGDLNGDGLVDLVAGTWPEETTRIIYMKKGGGHSIHNLSDEAGAKTLSILISDMDQDGRQDLMIGNDWEVPDFFYVFDKNGKIREVKDRFKQVTMYTMSLDTGDLDNDLTLDFFASDMSFDRDNHSFAYCDHVLGKKSYEGCKTLHDVNIEVKNSKMKKCDGLREYSQDCMISSIASLASFQKNPTFCEKIPMSHVTMREICFKRAKAPLVYIPKADDVEQVNRNVLVLNKGELEDKTAEWNANASSWSWNAKFADYNQDGFQDILIGNGFVEMREHSKNNLLINQGGRRFDKREVDDQLQTSTYAIIDLDLDGDLDVVASGFLSNPKVYQNGEVENKSIMFKLVDRESSIVGSRLIISYGDGQKQIREFKKSGGYMSFDQDYLHFGLGKSDLVDQLEIIWADGAKTTISGPLKSGMIHQITRIYF